MIHHIRPYYPYDCNCYLLTGDSNVLIDTGTGFAVQGLISEISDVLNGATLNRVLLTHCHFDHIGGCPSLIDRYGCDIYAGHIDAVPIREGDDTYTLSSDPKGIPVKDLSQGDVIDIGQHRLRIIETPGHTSGGVCFYDEISSSLFSGDTIFSDSIGRTDLPSGSLSSLRNSIKYLNSMAVKQLYPGHGDPTTDWASAIKRALQMVGD